jgi:hypothetical protein
MKKVLTGLFVMLATLSLTAQSQNITVAEKLPHLEKRYTIAAHPLYIFNNGMRLDFEKRIRNTPSWIQCGIAGYWLSEGEQDYNYGVLISGDELNELRGVGLELNYKHFVDKKETLYFAGGCSYSHYGIEYVDAFWRTYTEDGQTFWTKERGHLSQNINKLGINTYFGYQSPRPTFLADMFIGIGYRYSFYSNSMAHPFNDRMLSLGYRGLVFITGVRLGAKFK